MRIVSIVVRGCGPAAKTSLAVTSFSFEENTNMTPKLELENSHRKKRCQYDKVNVANSIFG